MGKEQHYTRTKDTYNKIAKAWADKNFRSRKIIGEMRIFRNYIKPGGKILDVGVGPGRHARKFIARGYNVIGIDFSKGMVEEAKRRVPRGDFRLMDMRNLKFKNGTFNGIWCFASLLHIEKKDAPSVVNGFKRVLRPGGILAISVKKGSGERLVGTEAGFAGKRFFSFYTEGELTRLVRNAGFEVMQIRLKHLKDDWIVIMARAPK